MLIFFFFLMYMYMFVFTSYLVSIHGKTVLESAISVTNCATSKFKGVVMDGHKQTYWIS